MYKNIMDYNKLYYTLPVPWVLTTASYRLIIMMYPSLLSVIWKEVLQLR